MARGNGKRAAPAAAAAKVEVRPLAVKLNDKALLDRGDEMADAELRIARLGLDRSQLNDQIRELKKRRLELGNIIDTGEEQQDVKCEWRADYTRAVWTLYRTDTQQQVAERTMTAEDMQTSMLPGEEPPPVPPARQVAADKPARARKAARPAQPVAAAAPAPAPAPRVRKARAKLTVAPQSFEAPPDIIA